MTDNPRFKPGQYMTIGLNNQAKPELGSVRRPMSIVSAPEEGDVFEFYVRFVSHPESDNPLTHLLWNAKTDDRVFLRSKGAGTFTLEDTIGAADKRKKICVAAGTGLAPFLSMVRSVILRDPQAKLDDFVILHGASYPADLGYQEELAALRERGLHYFGTISRPQSAPDWQGDVGRVEDYFKPGRIDQLEERIGLPPGGLLPHSATIYICGLQGTIGETVMRPPAPRLRAGKQEAAPPARGRGKPARRPLLRAIRHHPGGPGRRRRGDGSAAPRIARGARPRLRSEGLHHCRRPQSCRRAVRSPIVTPAKAGVQSPVRIRNLDPAGLRLRTRSIASLVALS